MFLMTARLIWRQRDESDEGLRERSVERGKKENEHGLLLIEVHALAFSENYKTSKVYGHPSKLAEHVTAPEQNVSYSGRFSIRTG